MANNPEPIFNEWEELENSLHKMFEEYGRAEQKYQQAQEKQRQAEEERQHIEQTYEKRFADIEARLDRLEKLGVHSQGD